MINDDDQVAHHLRMSHQHVVECVTELEDQRLHLIEPVRLFQLLIIKHSGKMDKYVRYENTFESKGTQHKIQE